jgi:hypothetical protein
VNRWLPCPSIVQSNKTTINNKDLENNIYMNAFIYRVHYCGPIAIKSSVGGKFVMIVPDG